MPPFPAHLRQTLDKAVSLHRSGKLDEAAVLYRTVLQEAPGQSDALNLLGLIVMQEGNAAEALDLFTRAVAASPRMVAAQMQRGLCLRQLGRHSEAVDAFRTLAGHQPRSAEARLQLGLSLKDLHRLPEAIEILKEAARLGPNDGLVWLSLGVAWMDSGNLVEAVDCFGRAVRLQPSLPEAHEILGQALLEKGDLAEARNSLMEALRLRPGYPEAYHDLGRLCTDEVRLEEAIASYRKAVAGGTGHLSLSNLLFLLHYVAEISPEERFAAHRQWNELYAAPLKASWRPHQNDFSPERRLRIGYVSADFVNHAVTTFFEPFLAGHNRQQFEVFCYSNVKKPDEVTARLKARADVWREIALLEDEQVAELVRQDRIDVLVDLAGHTTGNRLLVFARKPAPVQITWLGYPNTTGLEAMDYRITEALSDPPGRAEALHREQVLRLPETFLCYGPEKGCPEVGPLPALSAGHVTFGCFNNVLKVGPKVVELWSRLLRELPGSRLFLKSWQLSRPETAARLLEQFSRCGIGAERVDIQGGRVPAFEHLSLYHRVDIGLDPFPYNGTTTTCETLWMGVPVVALEGDAHVSRVGLSLLANLGAPEWVARTPEEYISKCRELAGDLPRLAAIRAGLRERMRQSPLCDAPRFVRHFEGAIRQVWRRRCG